MRSKAAHRSGASLVVALVALAVAGALSLSLLKTAVLRQDRLRLAQQSLQAEWLATSGAGRAAARIARDPQYQGETWQLAAEEIGARDPGVVTIRVQTLETEPAKRRIDVVAQLGDDATRRVQRSKQIILEVPTAGAPP